MAVKLSRSAFTPRYNHMHMHISSSHGDQHQSPTLSTFQDAVMHSFVHLDCRGTQHQDCVRLLQRLHATAKQPVNSSRGVSCAAVADDALCELSQDRADISFCSWPSSSSLLTVQKSEEHGRQLAVARDTAPGTVLWTEQPFVHLLLKQHRKQVCHVLLADKYTLQRNDALHAAMSLAS